MISLMRTYLMNSAFQFLSLLFRSRVIVLSDVLSVGVVRLVFVVNMLVASILVSSLEEIYVKLTS